MDPLTHALAGATIASFTSGRTLGARAALIGAAAGLLPDLDVFIRSAADPLLAIEHHRGFTHSLVMVPAGGTVAALLTGGRRAWSNRAAAALAGAAAWASHALLDASTTYGTQLFWPFTRFRVGLDIISIIDPLFTLIVLIGCIASLKQRRNIIAATLVAATMWLAAGWVQRERASNALAALARARGHTLTRGAVFPTFGNTIVWRSIYESGGTLHMDRIRVPWTGPASVKNGDRAPLVTSAGETGRARRDFQRFAWFSDGWVARDPRDTTVIGDARYSLESSTYVPVWGIRLHEGGVTEWVNRSRQRRISVPELWREVVGAEGPR